jgi:hypothetical protein
MSRFVEIEWRCQTKTKRALHVTAGDNLLVNMPTKACAGFRL